MMRSKSISVSNVMSSHNNQIALESGASQDTKSGSIWDPICVKRKGAPKKLRKKSPMESSLNRVKATLSSTKGKRLKESSNMGDVAPVIKLPQQGGNHDLQFTQHLQSTCIVLPTSVIFNSQGWDRQHLHDATGSDAKQSEMHGGGGFA
ncbi:uncharacterized protein LOC111369400 [Olea europaea var. sylvestris]|uniref:uncharacterized protein LOC111369400 n=1 Tax=Olea europaea var. sylvestris TaxID=158386 RepID=UPI000C1CE29C|nr:uncharacterized protein LOC111369400 [Olea europaea var. sylvestris]